MAGSQQLYIDRIILALKKYCSNIKIIIAYAVKGFDQANIKLIIDCFDGRVQKYALDCYYKAKSLASTPQAWVALFIISFLIAIGEHLTENVLQHVKNYVYQRLSFIFEEIKSYIQKVSRRMVIEVVQSIGNWIKNKIIQLINYLFGGQAKL